MPRTAEHIVAAHEYARERRAARLPVWDMKLAVTIDDAVDPATTAGALAAQLKGSAWAASALKLVQREWAEDPATTAEPDFLYDTNLGEIVDELEMLAAEEDVSDADVSRLLDAMYDLADLGPIRVWVEIDRFNTFEEVDRDTQH